MVSGRRILLVEDEPTLQRILGSVLSDAGHTVETVATAEAAMERIDDSGQPDLDLILSDKNLPAQNGLDLLRHCRRRDAENATHHGFVLVTGYPSRDSALTILAHGGDGYLVKPFRSLVHAIQAIDRVLDVPRERAQSGFHLGGAVKTALEGNGAFPSGVSVSLLVDDESVAPRLRERVTTLGANIVDVDALLTQALPRVLVAGRVEDLTAYRARDVDAALVLVDGAAAFNALVELIDARGVVVEPTRIPGVQ